MTRNSENLGIIGEWGDRMNPEDKGMFQNVNGITTYSNTHAEIQQNIMRFQNHITGLSETNVKWRNYGFRDSWERKMQAGFTILYFSHSSCNEGNLQVLQ